MAYFINKKTSSHFISLFFSHNERLCNGFILPVEKTEIIWLKLIPIPFFILLITTIFQIFNNINFILNIYQLSSNFISTANVLFLSINVVCGILTSIFVTLSQVRGMRKQQIVQTVQEPLHIDWMTSLAIYATMVLFGLNGILFISWVETLPIDERFNSSTEFWITFLIFLLLALPGILRLHWLWTIRRFDTIHWK